MTWTNGIRSTLNGCIAFWMLASQKGIVVELTVFSNTYSNEIWALNPFRAENNKQHVGPSLGRTISR